MVKNLKKNALIFMSGTGSNAEALLEFSTKDARANFQVVALVTDRVATSRTYEIAKKFQLPVIALDIFEFYQQHGESGIGLITPKRWEIRELWTKTLAKMIKDTKLVVDFILLAGFEPLTNITNDYMTLNVHPGDLTFEINGARVLNGLSVKPIEYAISLGHKSLRSSVIVAQNFTGKHSDIDSGPILGISDAMPINFCGFEQEYLQKLYRERPAKLGKHFSDDLRKVAKINNEKLKYAGDHVVFVQATNDFANGKFKIAENGKLFYEKDDHEFVAIKTVEYHADYTKKLIF